MRKTGPQDVNRILEFLMEYFIENQKQMPMKISFDVPQTRAFITHALNHPDLISYISDNGVILGELGETWFGPNKVARGLIWYVKPAARNGILARRLLKAFNDEAKARGARYAKQDLDNPASIGKVDGLVKLAGYRDFSKTYLMELN